MGVMTVRLTLIRIIKSYGDNTANKHYKENNIISVINSAWHILWQNIRVSMKCITPYHANITHVK